MTTQTPEMDFDFSTAYGAEASKEGSKGGAPIRRVDWLKIDGSAPSMAAGKNQAMVRFLTDFQPVASNPVPWITVDMHSMVPTKNPPADLKDGQKWPRSMGCVCRNDKIFKARYGDCYVCANIRRDNKPIRASGKTWALAVLRERVVGDQALVDAGKIPATMIGQVVGVRDQTREVAIIGTQEMAAAGQIKAEDIGKPTGDTEVVPAIVIVQQAYKNFFSHLQGFAGYHGTVLDRDYIIIRNGDDTGTTYQIIPMDPIMLDANTKYDLRDPALMAQYDLPDLRKFVAEQASDDYYARFFDPNKTAVSRNPQTGQPVAQGQQQQAAPPTPAATNFEPQGDSLAALKSRVEGYAPGQEQQASPAAAEQPAQQPAAPPAAVPGGMQAL